MSVRVKICGVTSAEDARLITDAGADAIGLVFYQASSRYIAIEQAKAIADCVGPFTTLVGLFVDADSCFIDSILQQVPLHLLQFHGDESRAYCEQFRRPYLKALRMKADLDVLAKAADYSSAAGILLDTYCQGKPGGTGTVFDWSKVPSNLSRPLVLAGGLNAENVSDAIAQTHPYAVDVSGGVESAPGRKDMQKVAEFIALVKSIR